MSDLEKYRYANMVSNADLEESQRIQAEAEAELEPKQEKNWFQSELERAEAGLTTAQKWHRRRDMDIPLTGVVPYSARKTWYR